MARDYKGFGNQRTNGVLEPVGAAMRTREDGNGCSPECYNVARTRKDSRKMFYCDFCGKPIAKTDSNVQIIGVKRWHKLKYKTFYHC